MVKRNLRDRLVDWTIDRIASLDRDGDLPAWVDELGDYIERDAMHKRLSDGEGDQ
ncbi:hypothetical protein [Roseateles sp.]|uniref:hypothetical protein n=1 Tax=Roseateles sp. TaxID=1971397 RepID=UPI002F3F137C